MSKLETGGSAFPLLDPIEGTEWGMTLLDHFAGVALQSLFSDETYLHVLLLEARDRKVEPGEALARTSYDLAAAMVAEKRRLEKGDL